MLPSIKWSQYLLYTGGFQFSTVKVVSGAKFFILVSGNEKHSFSFHFRTDDELFKRLSSFVYYYRNIG